MGLDAIVEEIKAKGKAEAQKINEETSIEVSKILTEAKSQAYKIKTEKEETVKKEIERLKQQELSSAYLEVKRAMLNARKEVLDEAYNKAKDNVKALNPDKNKNILKSIIKKYEGKSSKIYSNSKDKSIVIEFSKLKYAGEINSIGGVILENSDSTESLDFRYDTILNNVSEQSLKQVSDILFR